MSSPRRSCGTLARQHAAREHRRSERDQVMGCASWTDEQRVTNCDGGGVHVCLATSVVATLEVRPALNGPLFSSWDIVELHAMPAKARVKVGGDPARFRIRRNLASLGRKPPLLQRPQVARLGPVGQGFTLIIFRHQGRI